MKRVKKMKIKRRAQKQKLLRVAQSFQLKILGKVCIRKVRTWTGRCVSGGVGCIGQL